MKKAWFFILLSFLLENKILAGRVPITIVNEEHEGLTKLRVRVLYTRDRYEEVIVPISPINKDNTEQHQVEQSSISSKSISYIFLELHHNKTDAHSNSSSYIYASFGFQPKLKALNSLKIHLFKNKMRVFPKYKLPPTFDSWSIEPVNPPILPSVPHPNEQEMPALIW